MRLRLVLQRSPAKANGVMKDMVVKKPFGGYTVSFKSVADMTLGDVFGTAPITPSEMTKKIWAVIKRKGLSKK